MLCEHSLHANLFGCLCSGFMLKSPFYKESTGRWQTMIKIWFFEVVMAIEMCEGELKGALLVGLGTLGGYWLRAGRFVCVSSPTSQCSPANSLKNWSRLSHKLSAQPCCSGPWSVNACFLSKSYSSNFLFLVDVFEENRVRFTFWVNQEWLIVGW